MPGFYPDTDPHAQPADADLTTLSASTAAFLALANDADNTVLRATLGLGDAATRNVGTTAGTVAAGDDSRFGAESGAQNPTVRAVTVPYTVASDDYVLEVSGTGALTLPAASAARALKVRALDGTVDVTRNDTPGTDTVEGAASFALGAGSAAEFITRGAGAWRLF